MVFPQVYLSVFWPVARNAPDGRQHQLFTLCKGTANSPFLWGAISGVPRGRYLPSSDVAIGEMQYFYIENYIQTQQVFWGSQQGVRNSGRLKADDRRILVFFCSEPQ